MKRLLTILFAVLIAAEVSAAGYVLVVHPSNPVTAMERKDVARLFQKKTVRWEHGVDAEPVDLQGQSEVREAFSKDVLGKSVTAVKAWWQQRIFSGRGVPPPEKEKEKDILDFVRQTPGAIGYVSATAELDGVKAIPVR